MTQPNDNQEPAVLLFERSPFGNLDAIVQQDQRTVYFYLNQPKSDLPFNFGTRACWERNLITGPLVFDVNQMDRGEPPVFPRTQTVSNTPLPIPDPNDLEVVWFEEGNAAALFENSNGESRILAVIPPWSGEQGFMGYSAECAMEHPMCAPIPDSDAFRLRIQRSREFWQSIVSQPSPFAELQSKQMEIYRQSVGRYFGTDSIEETNYFDVHPDAFPPRGMVEFRYQDELFLFTTGMGLCPQPNIEMKSQDPLRKRRVEFGFHCPLNRLTETGIDTARKLIANMSLAPWRFHIWFDAGHTCDFLDVIENEKLAYFSDSNEVAMDLGDFRGDPVRMLWVIPGPRPETN